MALFIDLIFVLAKCRLLLKVKTPLFTIITIFFIQDTNSTIGHSDIVTVIGLVSIQFSIYFQSCNSSRKLNYKNSNQ